MRAIVFGMLGLFGAVGCGNSVSSSTGGSGGGTGGSTTGSGGTGGGCATSVMAAPGTAITRTGAVVGAKAGTTWAWKGVPYAAPPVGDLRWKRPTAHACWDDARPASDFGAACVQIDASGKVTGEEDCLTVNVWAPEDASSGAPVPVLFFIHGGGEVQGSSSVATGGTVIYDGQAMSELGHVAVVTINYRLGPFGWLSHPAFAEGDEKASGNYGALDEVFALQWVKDNIGAFGGDPSHVLVFGESAGGVNTCLMLTSPLAKGLFSAALVESGGCVAQTKTDAEAVANDWAVKAACDKAADPAACMRALPADQVELLVPAPVEVAGKQGPFQPHVDGYLLLDAPEKVIEAGSHNHVPFAMGNNENETGAAVPLTMTEAEYQTAVKTLLAPVADKVLAQYPVADYPTVRDAYVAVTTDAKFVCPTRRTLRAAAGAQKEPVYRYQFTHVLENVGAMAKAKGSFHGLELFFVFGQLGVAGYKASPGEKDLSAAIQGYWSRFGATGDPNGGSAVKWPVYDAAKDSYLELETTISAKEGVHTAKCDFWDSLLVP